MIVIAAQTRSPLARALIGSVADKVLRGSSIRSSSFAGGGGSLLHPAKDDPLGSVHQHDGALPPGRDLL